MVRTGKRLVAISKLKIDLQGDSAAGSDGGPETHQVRSTNSLSEPEPSPSSDADPNPGSVQAARRRSNLN
jgi:hypothetical protein